MDHSPTSMGPMPHDEKRRWLIDWLLAENPDYAGMRVPDDEGSQRLLLRALMNVREAAPVSRQFRQVQDAYLREDAEEKGIVDASRLPDGMSVWQGDITRLGVGAIVNAANSGMTGCYVPNHGCIDNAIHTFAGVELRLECARIMAGQGHPEPTGRAKITKAYNLPARFVVHTVGPIADRTGTDDRPSPTAEQERQLRSCYESCLRLADEHGLASIAFPCISTGVFGFPHELAARIAVNTVRDFLSAHAHPAHPDSIHSDSAHSTSTLTKVVFDVFSDQDKHLYDQLLRHAA